MICYYHPARRPKMNYKVVIIAVSALFIIGALPASGRQALLPNSSAEPIVSDNDALSHTATELFPEGYGASILPAGMALHRYSMFPRTALARQTGWRMMGQLHRHDIERWQ